MDAAGSLEPHPNVEEVFRDFRARRSALLKAFTTEFEEFYHQCHPETENLCLYGLPTGHWVVDLPVQEVPSDLPEPTLGINFSRDGMPKEDWRSLVALHSDAWLLSVAFYFGARYNFDTLGRERLFNMINGFPTLYEVVTRASKKQAEERSSVTEHSSSRSKSNSEKSKKSITEANDEDDDEQDNTVCAACGENYGSDEFWICCDICEKWSHGKCVKITPAKAKHIKQFNCPACKKGVRH